jgi:nitrogen fixation/metabolism regulation signal transduction histidine kinase
VSLRARLILSLLLLALLPTAALTWFTVTQLDSAMRLWFSPEVQQTLEDAEVVGRGSLARLDAFVSAGVDDWASRPVPAPAERAAVVRHLGDAGLDFLQVYRRSGAGWALEQQVEAERVVMPERFDLGAEVGAAIDSTGIIHSDRGVLAGVVRAADGRAVLAGVWVAPRLFARADHVASGLAHYDRLSIVVGFRRLYEWLLLPIVVAAVLIVAILLAGALARSTARPLSELAAAFGRVAGGDLATRVAPRGARELRALGEGFNTMITRLREAGEAVRRAEREAAWREVARRLAHEIKNPLTAMQISLHRLQSRIPRMPEEQRPAAEESLGVVLAEIANLERLADQFARYAKFPEPRLEPLDLAEVVAATVRLHEDGGGPLRVSADGPCPVRGDRLLLTHALHNLILNAREAGPPGAPVEIEIHADDGAAIVDVLDRGAGLEPNAGGTIFDPYVSTKERGSGLGLTLVRDIVRQHGGSIELDNRAGGGARARMTLPALGLSRGRGTEGAT